MVNPVQNDPSSQWMDALQAFVIVSLPGAKTLVEVAAIAETGAVASSSSFALLAPAVAAPVAMGMAFYFWDDDIRSYLAAHRKETHRCGEPSTLFPKRPMEWQRRVFPNIDIHTHDRALTDAEKERIIEILYPGKQQGDATQLTDPERILPGNDPSVLTRVPTASPTPRMSVLDVPRISTAPETETAYRDPLNQSLPETPDGSVMIRQSHIHDGTTPSPADFLPGSKTPKDVRAFTTPTMVMQSGDIPDDLSSEQIGEILSRIIDHQGKPEDFVTLFATSPGRVVSVLEVHFRNVFNDDPDNPFCATLMDPLVPSDAKIAMTLLTFVNDDVRDQANAALGELPDFGDDPNEFAMGVRDIYRRLVPGADAVLEKVDAHFQKQAQEMSGATVLSQAQLKEMMDTKYMPSAQGSLAILFMGREMASWLMSTLRVLRDAGNRRYVDAATLLFVKSDFRPEQLGMMVYLLVTNRRLATTIVDLVVPHLKTDRALADQILRQLYIANNPLGEYVLAEFERRNNLPEVRSKRAFDAAMADNGRERTWRKATFSIQQSGGQAELVQSIQRALVYADSGDEAELRGLAGNWIDLITRAPKEVLQGLRGYTQDPDSHGIFTYFNSRSYDPAIQPFGFLLPHERRFWDQKISDAHPTIQLLHQIERVRPDGFRREYAALTDPTWFNEGNTVVRRAAKGEIAGVDQKDVQELMRRAVLDPQFHAALLYWGASEPSQGPQHVAWGRVPARVGEILDHARRHRSHVAGNLLEVVLRSGDYGGVAELNAVRHFANDRGSWVHMLPNDYAHRRQVADLLVIDKAGEQQVVEVKNVLYQAKLSSVEGALTEAASQLASSHQDYPLARQVVYLRLALPNGTQLPEEVNRWIQAHLKEDPRFANVGEVVVEAANARDRADRSSVVIVNPRHSKTPNGNGGERLAGPGVALQLADRLVELRVVRPEQRNQMLVQLAKSPRTVVDRILNMPPNPVRLREAVNRYKLSPLRVVH